VARANSHLLGLEALRISLTVFENLVAPLQSAV
jgi:hypothetical protein